MAIDLTELEWAINDVTLPNANGPNKIEPVSALKTSGVDWEQLLNAEELNWMFFKIYKAIEDLDSRTVVAGQLPIGSEYTNHTDSRNPGVILGYGTWISLAGTITIGAGTHTDADGVSRTFTAGDTGGEYQVTLTTTQLPPHNHPVSGVGSGALGISGSHLTLGGAGNTSSTGGGQAHNNIQPYIVAYKWRRTA